MTGMTPLPPHSKEKGFTPEDDQGEGMSEIADWQPIETAPRNGDAWFKRDDIDLWHREQGRLADCFWRKEYNAWFARSGGRTFNMGGDENFTHWMPLPKPPSTLTDEAKLRRSKALDELGALDGEMI